MPTVAELMEQHFSSEHGTVDVRAVLTALEETDIPRAPALIAFLQDPRQRRWRLPALDGLRKLVAQNECNMEEARILLTATDEIAAESGLEEYLKTFHALVSSTECAHALEEFIQNRAGLSDDDRWLSFYAAGLLAQRQRAITAAELRDLLESAMEGEPETSGRSSSYAEVLHNLA